jgi:chromosome segregation ATPase
VVNQWGRDGTSTSSSSRPGGGMILIPAIIALVIGGAGGYAGARYISGVSTSDIQSREKKIDDLQKTLQELKFDNDGASTEQGVLRGRVKDLEGQLAAANRLKESLRSEIDKQVAAAKREAQGEIDALQKTLDEAGDLNGALGRARKSLKVSELQIIELEKTVSDQKARIDKLEAAADAGAGEATATLAALKKTNANLRASLDDAKKRLTSIPRLEDEIASLKEELSKRSDDASADTRKEIADLREQNEGMEQKLMKLSKSAGIADEQARKLSELQQQLDGMTQTLAEKDKVVRDAGRDLKAANARIDKQSGQLDALNAQLAKATPTKPGDGAQPADGRPDTGGMTPRDSDDVEKAVADLPGFGNLTEASQLTLVTMLERGECVTSSLKAAYGHVPAVALRNLIRELGGRC